MQNIISDKQIEQKLQNLLEDVPDSTEEEWNYRQAAAVLDYFSFNEIRPLRGEPNSQEALKSLFSVSNVCYDENYHPQRSLTNECRREALEMLHRDGIRDGETGVQAFKRALAANPERPTSELQNLLESYINAAAPTLENQSRLQLLKTSQIAVWLHGLLDNVPAPSEIHQQLSIQSLLNPFKFLLDITPANPKGNFYGRKKEINVLYDYVEFYAASSLTEWLTRGARHVLDIKEKPPLVIYAPGGMGKSTLLAKFVIDHAKFEHSGEAVRLPFVYLDFDRPVLNAGEPVTLLLEAIEQLSAQFPEAQPALNALREKWNDRLKPSPNRETVPSREKRNFRVPQREIFVQEFAERVNEINSENLPFLLILDTFEEVQWRSRVYVDEVFSFLGSLQRSIPTLRTVIAGRAEIENAVHPVSLYKLDGFDREAAREMLIKRGVQEPGIADAIAAQVGGSPLTLKLAAELYKLEGAGKDGIRDLQTKERFFWRLKEETIQAQFFNRILGHVHDPRVKKLVHPGLVLRRITPELILEVLAVPCEVEVADLNVARELFEILKTEVALVTPEGGDVLVHRADLRNLMLDLLKQDESTRVQQIHELAIRFYERFDDNVSRAEEIYHRLSLGLDRQKLAERWQTGLQFSRDAIDELPVKSQAFLAAQLRVEVKKEIWLEADWEDWQLYAVRAARELVDAGKPAEALSLINERKLEHQSNELKTIEIDALALLNPPSSVLQVAAQALDQAIKSGDKTFLVDLTLRYARLAKSTGELPDIDFVTNRFKKLVEWCSEDFRVIYLGLECLKIYRLTSNVQSLKELLATAVNALPASIFVQNQERIREVVTELSIPNFAMDMPEVAPVAQEINSKSVFVISKNVRAREQMFKFLRTLSLEPTDAESIVEAEETQELPDHSPDVYSSLQSAQCVLALFTPEDFTKQFGEDLSLSKEVTAPPNLLWTMGLSFGLVGAQRTVVAVIKSGEIPGFLGNFDYVNLSNDPIGRKKLADRLRSAGCAINEDSYDYLSPASDGGNFDENFVSERNGSRKLDRGQFTEVIADSAISHDLDSINLDKMLHADLRNGSSIDLKYHYLGVLCAWYWLTLSSNSEYGHGKVLKFITDYFDEIINACEFGDRTVDLVSLGSGDGEIDVVILSKLTKRVPTFQYYYCVDISFELLQKAVARIIKQADAQNFAKRFNIKAIHGDFTELRRLAPIYTYDESINLFTLNGFTFGNYNESELLQKIREGMEFNDLLFFDARIHQLDDWDGESKLTDDQKQEVLAGYDNELNNRFAFGPVEYASNLSFTDFKFGYDVHHQITSVPKAVNVVTYCKDIKLKLRRDSKPLQLQRLDLAATTVYSYKDLVDWLPAKGFKLIWSKSEANLAMFLLKKE